MAQSARLLNTFLALGILIMVFYLLKIGQTLLIPLILAFFIWYLITGLTDFFAKVKVKGWQVPKWLAFGTSLVSILLMCSGVVLVVYSSLKDLPTAELGAEYQIKFEGFMEETVEPLLGKVNEKLGEGAVEVPKLQELFKGLDFPAIFKTLVGGLTGLVGDAGLIAIYLMFFFLEQTCFRPKLNAMLPEGGQREHVLKIINRIDRDIKTYIGIKTFTSVLTGVLSFLLMWVLGLEFAVFWALLIFLLNFIPSIGSIIATIFPTVWGLLQFSDSMGEFAIGKFAVLVVGLSAFQLVIGNVVEPKMMGSSLNLSTLVIMISLTLWNAMWGIPGMFLCVPITVIAVIICANFEKTRPVAILLSKDGQVTV